MSGAPFVAITYSARPARLSEKAWDRSLIVPPFARLTVQISAPLNFDKVEDRERVRAQIEDFMNQQMWALDRAMGLLKVEAERPST